MWVAINRSEDRANGYGQSLLDEIARPNQWQGYDETALYTDKTYAMAKQVLEIQANGSLRPWIRICSGSSSMTTAPLPCAISSLPPPIRSGGKRL